jgi:hypothetical protein
MMVVAVPRRGAHLAFVVVVLVVRGSSAKVVNAVVLN